MSKFSKYLIDNSDACTLTFQSDESVTEFKSRRVDRGLMHYHSTDNIVWKLIFKALTKIKI